MAHLQNIGKNLTQQLLRRLLAVGKVIAILRSQGHRREIAFFLRSLYEAGQFMGHDVSFQSISRVRLASLASYLLSSPSFLIKSSPSIFEPVSNQLVEYFALGFTIETIEIGHLDISWFYERGEVEDTFHAGDMVVPIW